jgi:Nuclease-related domain
MATSISGCCDNHNDVVWRAVRTARRIGTDAGQSAADRYCDACVVHRRLRLACGLLLLLSAASAAAGWWLWLRAGPARSFGGLRVPPTWTWMMAVAAFGAWAAWRKWPRDDPARWLRGAAGERATAALLARLPRRRWTVLHDRAVPGSRANVDHVVIGPSGVWVVDSKTCRGRLRVRRGRVWAGSQPVATGPAAWEAKRVGDLLEVPVTPIVAVHGEGLRRRGKRSDGVRVVPASGLLRRLRRPPRVLSGVDAATLARRAAHVLRPYREHEHRHDGG